MLQGYKYCAIMVVRQPSDSQTITAHYLTDLPADSLTDTLCVRVCVYVCMRQSHEFWFTSQSILYLRNKSHQAFFYSDRQTNGKGWGWCLCLALALLRFRSASPSLSFSLAVMFLSIFFLLFLMDVYQTALQSSFLFGYWTDPINYWSIMNESTEYFCMLPEWL